MGSILKESDHKRRLVSEITLLGGYARRIEDRFAVGALDMIIKPPRHSMLFAEGKVIGGNVFEPTLRQFEEGKRIIAAGVSALLIGWNGGKMYVSPWVAKADKRDCYEGRERNYALTLIGYLEQGK